ncbi:hypothetical protein M4B38_25525 [Klebsiella pneumoniae]|nr:hypothetical protein [Klebsiella pneumoniae]MCM6213511.1 hypothetical protein [Klebsiella pneumoniae]
MTIETKLINGKYPLPGKYPLRVVNVMQENNKTIMLVEPDEVKPGLILDRFLNLNENDFVIINDCLIEDEKFLKGKSFVFTGTIDKRVELTNALTINYEGKICGPLSEKVDYLIVGNEPTKRRINRALSWGIPMISAEFLYEWLNLKREEAIKKQIFGNFNTTAFSEAMAKVADQLKRDLDRMAIRSATMRKAAEVANIEGMAFVKVTPESCEVIKSSDIVMMVRRDSEPEASQAVNPVGLHQSTGERPATAELNRFSNDAHNKPHDVIVPYAETGSVNYLFELKHDGSIYVKDCGNEYYFPIWLSQLTIAYCGKSKHGTDHRFYQRYDLAIKEISNCSKSHSENCAMVNDFKRLIDYVHRSMPDHIEVFSKIYDYDKDGERFSLTINQDGHIQIVSVKDNRHFTKKVSEIALDFCGKSKDGIKSDLFQNYAKVSEILTSPEEWEEFVILIGYITKSVK